MSTLPHESLNTSDSAATAMDEEAIEELLDELQEWILKRVDGISRVEKRYHFNDFAQLFSAGKDFIARFFMNWNRFSSYKTVINLAIFAD